MLSWVISSIGLAGCFLVAAVLSAVETALVGLPAASVKAAMRDHVAGAARLNVWLRHPAEVLTCLQLFRSVALLIAALLSLQLAAQLELNVPAVVLVVVLSVLSLVATQVLPRAIAKRFPLKVATSTMWFTWALTWSTWPLVWPVSRLGQRVAGLMGLPPETASVFWMPDELGRLATDANARSLGAGGEDLFLSIIEFSDTVIREIMVPRTDMVVLPLASSRDEVQQVLLDAGHSRIPVYDETIDDITGVLHVKDLFLSTVQPNRTFDLKTLLRPTFYVPEIMKISELLREFQKRATHMAIVVDEYGGTAGVVTLEDIIEEIVGEIKDEYDVDEKQFRVLSDNKIIADARVNIWDLEAALGVEFPDDDDYETLAGFLMSRSGALPAAGTQMTWNNLRFTIKEADEKRIRTVEIERH